MIPELLLTEWLKIGLALYKAHPILLEQVFFDASQKGFPTAMEDTLLTDASKRWLPGFFTGGTLRYGGQALSILGNTVTTLTVAGGLGLVTDSENLGYTIVPPYATKLMQYLAENPLPVVLTSYAQLPATMPCFSLRLEQDMQGDSYIGETFDQSYVIDGVEYIPNFMQLTGRHLIGIWTTNPDATLWLYAWLMNYALASLQQLDSWGFSDVSFQGSDIDPAIQFLPERVFTRHLLLTATRPERAVNLLQLEPIDALDVDVDAQYATITHTVPFP